MIKPMMKKNLIFVLPILIFTHFADAATRDTNTISRSSVESNNINTSINRSAVKTTTRTTSAPTRTANNVASSARSATINTRTNTTPIAQQSITARNSAVSTNTPNKSIVSRSATQTNTGLEYEQCRTAYFTCMDQFCEFKNDTFRRCSCSDRVFDMTEAQSIMEEASEQLTVFVENLDAVGLTTEQALAMKTASDGENALTEDGSDSKALLQAIMNSIRGEDTNVSGNYSDLNYIDLSFDTANSFGTADTGQTIAAYNGQNLYTAVYPQCRDAVRADCNDASLQRAVTAYLMAVEQDCNTVESALKENQKKLTAGVYESSALLDLARIENRQKLNSDDFATCLANVESAVLSEEVCGTDYRKCLDNGEFIDLTTGEPIAGVVRFYELESLLSFTYGENMSEQKLSQNSNNQDFVNNFENRVKKFAEPALNKCVENADEVWSDYLDKAMLDIFYAQKSKVQEIKGGCFDFISSCYANNESILDAAMSELSTESNTLLQPNKIALNSAVCQEYVDSCNNMFDNNILEMYVDNLEKTDTISACRAVAQQCFDKYGGTGYQNFYYPYSGLFTGGHALDWFSLRRTTDGVESGTYTSECANQLATIDACSAPEIIEEVFGGFDKNVIGSNAEYGITNNTNTFEEHKIRDTGIATEVYNQILDILTAQCATLQGRFTQLKNLKELSYQTSDICSANFNNPMFASAPQEVRLANYVDLASIYGVFDGENMCPRNYSASIDTASWGACLCWENGARRSINGTSVKCVSAMPINGNPTQPNNRACTNTDTIKTSTPDEADWCIQSIENLEKNQVCPLGTSYDEDAKKCTGGSLTSIQESLIPEGT